MEGTMERRIREKSTHEHEALTIGVPGWGVDHCIWTIYRHSWRGEAQVTDFAKGMGWPSQIE